MTSTTADVPVAEAPQAAPASEPRLMAHAYDGIHEYDNPLPGWWKAIFIASIVFAVMYGFYFHIANWGTTPAQRYQTELAEYNSTKTMRDAAEAAHVNEAALARNALDAKHVEHGAAVFATRCVVCHTADGHGEIGPNLTDNFQIHGTTRMDIFHTIHDGAPGTAMIAWGEQMAAGDIVDVATFVTTLRGQNIKGKPPQGEPVGAFAP